MSDLTIGTTNKCNMACSFCVNKEDMRSNPDTLEPIVKLAMLKDIMNTKPFDTYGFTGGEPLMNLDFLIPAIMYIKDKQPKATIVINTNGLLLDSNLISFFNFYDIRVRVAFSGVSGSEKSVEHAIKQSKKTNLVSLINTLKDLMLVMVVFPHTPFAKDISDLSKIFNATCYQLNTDTYSKFDLTDILYMEKELQHLSYLSPKTVGKVGFFQAITECREKECYNFDNDGKLIPYNCERKFGWNGCPDLFNYFNSLDDVLYFTDMIERFNRGLVCYQ